MEWGEIPEMSFKDIATPLAERKFKVFPIKAGTKDQPLIKNYPEAASSDLSAIENWDQLWPEANVGISTTHYGEDEALLVVDIDIKGDKRGDVELVKLELEGCELPSTFTQETPTGGRHLVYRIKEAVRQGTDVLGRGLDIRSKGGYVVAAGSTIGGASYRVADPLDPQPAPEWLIERIGKPRERQSSQVLAINPGSAIHRAVHYLEHEAPLAVEGDSGDHTTFKVAAKIKDFGVDQDTCLELLIGHWNERCDPPWDPEELKTKIANAYQYGLDPQGVAAPEAQFNPILPENTTPKESKNYLQQMNDAYALIYMEGNHFILHETIDEKGYPKRVFLTENTFKRRFSPYTVENGKKLNTFADIWLSWKGRREFAGVCFAPERKPRHNYYNLWRGFTVKPLPPGQASEPQVRGLEMFLSHAKENVCQGDEKLYQWLMGYFAHMIQRPFERPLTTLVFRGSKGTGKNALVDRVGKLLGSTHYLVAHDGRYLTSNFNGHMDSCLCLVLDEAFWSGDKSAEGKLKGLTTAPEIMIERKGKEPYMVDNLVRLIVIGNEEWLVPASHDERRYAVFDVGEGKKQVGEFFHTMRVLLDEEGGNQVLLWWLKQYDLSTVNVNKAPVTKGLLEQKHATLKPLEQWWLDCLMKGRIGHTGFEEAWPKEIAKDSFRKAFYAYCEEHNMTGGWRPNEYAIGKKLKEFLPSVDTKQKRREGDHTINVYRLPDLDQARREWEKHICSPIEWN
jgi:hypothetical protein